MTAIRKSWQRSIPKMISANFSWGRRYGENVQLYPELYTKKQLKLSVPIIEYVSDIADGIFREFDEYMQQK